MRKIVALTMLTTMGLGSMTGCSDKMNTQNPVAVTKSETETGKKEQNGSIDMKEVKSSANLLSTIKAKYAYTNEKPMTEYKDALYNVASDHVFSFDCNEQSVRDIAYDAFGVYTTTDYENPDKYIRNCATVSLENGKIVVKPSVVDMFYDIPEKSITADTNTLNAWKTECNGTWGNLNRLYLVQKYDLETGMKLDAPIITPFTVEHEIESATIKQKVDENNNYYLEWAPVSGAESYLVYRINGTTFTLVDKTTETKVASDSFKGQLHTDMWSDIVNAELAENGYDTTTTERMTMNSDLYKNKDSKFAVVVVKNGKTSGISNIADPNEIADSLPYEIADHDIEVTIDNVYDMPTYVTMTTVNGKSMQMLIDYHGSSSKYEDDNSTTYYLYPKVYHAGLSPFKITIHGMPYGEFKKQAQALAERQDNITSTMPENTTDPEISITNVPNRETEEKTNEKIENDIEIDGSGKTPVYESMAEEKTDETSAVPEETAMLKSTEESTNAPAGNDIGVAVSEDESETDVPAETATAIETTEGPSNETVGPAEISNSEKFVSTGNNGIDQVVNEVMARVTNNLSALQTKSGVDINRVIFADSPMEEWMAYCLMARSEYVPVPTSEFPEANDLEGTLKKLVATYRQNPTSGVISDLSYSYDFQTFVVTYADDTMDRLNKSVEELAKAKEVAESLTSNLSSDYDKIVALNDYFCANASYDHDSMSTNVDMTSLSQSFVDAHTPYGILCNNYGVCESYSEAMVLTGRLAGLNIITETGDLYGAGGHEWNRVNIDGNWCILDVTNNDNDLAVNCLCNITDNAASQILIPDHEAYTFAAPANTDAYEYYRKNSIYADDLDELKAKLKEQLDKQETAAVRCNASITQDQAVGVAQQLYREGYDLKDAYYVYNILVLKK